MFEQTKIAFIGGGNMANAIIAGLLKQTAIKPENIIASDPLAQVGEALKAEFGISTTTDNMVAIAEATIIILAVKPQYAADVFAQLKDQISADVLILSIMAGITISQMEHGLGTSTIVRVMPNTPARVGKGMSGWTATEQVTEAQKEEARTILGALGQEIYMPKEHFLDMTTALSGSGPAYVFLFIEALTDAGVHLGFPRPMAEEMALQTIEGSVAFAREFPQPISELRNMVTSPGGTTAAGLYELEKGGFRTTISKAVYAAYKKSLALGEN